MEQEMVEVNGDENQSEDENEVPIKKRKRSSSLEKELLSLSNDDDMTCTICFEPYQSCGEHKIVSLKCGHLFGDSCIRRWLREQKFCPQCKLKAGNRDIRTIYASKLKVYDNSREENLLLQLNTIQKSYDDLKRENDYNLMLIASHKAEIKRLKDENSRLLNSLQVSSEKTTAGIRSITGCKFYLEKNLDFKENLDSRLLKFLTRQNKVLISQKSLGMFSGYGIKFVDLQYFRPEKFINTSSKIINEFCVDSNESFLVTAQKDPLCKMFSLRTNETLSTFRSPTSVPFWSCCFDNERPHCLLLGGQNGNISKFDTRNTNAAYDEFGNQQLSSPVKYIVAMKGNQYFPRGGYFIVYVRGLSFHEDGTSRSTTLLTESVAHLTYDEKTEMLLITKSPTGSGLNFQPARIFLMKLLRDSDDPNSLPYLQNVHDFAGSSSSMPIFSRPTQVKVADGVIIVSYFQDTKSLQTRSCNQDLIYSETVMTEHIYDLCPIYSNNIASMFGAISNTRLRLYRMNLNY